MPMARGRECYNVSKGRVIACGFVLDGNEHCEALDTSIRRIIEDEDGVRQAKDTLSALTLTDFERANLDAILSPDKPLEDWRVGEAYGKAYLTEHRRCFFPWPDKWDERKSGSSLPGADLAGMQETDNAEQPYRFAFGEIKTSAEHSYPPRTMRGRTGLKQQLEDLRNRKPIRDDLFRYLMMRVQGAGWADQFQSAAKRYLADSRDVAVFGILVRDVPPDRRDLRARARTLSAGHPPKMHIELLAIYLPGDSIRRLAAFYSTAEGGG